MRGNNQTKFSGTKAVGVSILALCLLAFSQLLALLIGNMLVAGGMSAVTGNIFTGILYAGLVLGGVWLICKKMLKIPVTDFKVGKPDLHPFWIIAAFAMPLLVILVYQLFAGTWQQSSMEPENCSDRSIRSVWMSAYRRGDEYFWNDPGCDSRKSGWHFVLPCDLLYRNNLVFCTHAWSLELSDDRRIDLYRLCGGWYSLV